MRLRTLKGDWPMTTKRCLRRLAWLAVTFLLLWPALARTQPGTQVQRLPGTQPGANGPKTYPAICQNCHGGTYDPAAKRRVWKLKPLDRLEIQRMTDAQLTEAIYDCGGKMPSFRGKLTDAQMRRLIQYIRNFNNTK
jgi:mono/diheme cytochrome c family protein